MDERGVGDGTEGIPLRGADVWGDPDVGVFILHKPQLWHPHCCKGFKQ